MIQPYKSMLYETIRELKDKEVPLIVCSYKEVFTKSGYKYIILTETEQTIEAVIHYSVELAESETIGFYENQDVSIVSNEELKLTQCILKYRDLYIGIYSRGSYNENMGQYRYDGATMFAPIQSKFLIFDEKDIESEIGVDSSYVWSEFSLITQENLGISLLPNKYILNLDFKCARFEIKESSSISLATQKDSQIRQFRKDTVYIGFINLNTSEVLRFIKLLQDYSLISNTYGLITIPDLDNDETFQKSFLWESLTHFITFECSYYTIANTENEIKRIKDVLFSQLITQ